MLLIFGGHFLGVPSTIEGVVRVLGVSIPYQRLLILVVAARHARRDLVLPLPHAHSASRSAPPPTTSRWRT